MSREFEKFLELEEFHFGPARPNHLSILERLHQVERDCERWEIKSARMRKRRDRLVQEALAAGIPQAQIARAMGLTRQRIEQLSRAKVRL